ncbi:MAG: AAA family ATPase [Mycobacterium leprae]
MKELLRLQPEELCRKWDASQLRFSTTQELSDLEGLVGQERAAGALQFGIAMRGPGHGVYVSGPAGTGRTSYTTLLARSHAAGQPAPQDWVYVYNFDRPDEPLALALPAGAAGAFAREVEELIKGAPTLTGQALVSGEYQQRREELVRQMRGQVAQLGDEVERMARDAGFVLSHTGQGLAPVPVHEGGPLTEEQYNELPPETKREINEKAQVVRAAIAKARRRKNELEKAVQEQIEGLDMAAAQAALAPELRKLRERYRQMPQVADWLGRVEQELAETTLPETGVARALEEVAAAAEAPALPIRKRRTDPYARFRVNVFVSRRKRKGAPVVVEGNPTYANLFGKAEYLAIDPSLDDVAMQLKPGAVHRANGGFLILQVADLLRSPFALEALKRALATHEVRIEAYGQENRALPVQAIRPQPIPLDLKVILIGNNQVYHALYAQDEGFRKHFKLKAEFDARLAATPDNVDGYARFVAKICRQEKLQQFTAGAVGALLEYSHRLAEDQAKLSARMGEIVDLICEAAAWAEQEGASQVEANHVRRAVYERAMRSALPELSLQELIQRGMILVDVDGAVVGQVNGLTVMTVGDHSFGSPSRITAKVYMGQKGILHIEREIAMSGQIHDKGLLTLTAFLGDRFAQDHPLAFSASIAFEQTYVPVDGDSASSTELYALLSALSGIPISQGIAVTGSVNQRGEIQPIGGVNEKIEGFFRVCQLLGLTGEQGVMIPRRNLPNLALADEVVDAVRAGQFHIWGVSTIEEGIEILTGIPAGSRQPDGSYTPGSVFDRVDRRIAEFARRLFALNKGEEPGLL